MRLPNRAVNSPSLGRLQRGKPHGIVFAFFKHVVSHYLPPCIAMYIF